MTQEPAYIAHPRGSRILHTHTGRTGIISSLSEFEIIRKGGQ